MKNKILAASVFSLALFLIPQISHAKLSMNFVNISGRHSECLERAENAMRKVGLLNIERLDYSVFGTDAPYNVGIYCKADKGVAFFVAEGPEANEATRLLNTLLKAF